MWTLKKIISKKRLRRGKLWWTVYVACDTDWNKSREIHFYNNEKSREEMSQNQQVQICCRQGTHKIAYNVSQTINLNAIRNIACSREEI